MLVMYLRPQVLTLLIQKYSLIFCCSQQLDLE